MTRCGLWMSVLLVAGAAVAAAQDVDSDYTSLQEAVAKKDVDTIKKLAAETSALARQEIAKPGEADPDAAKKRLDDLRAIETYTEYALYATAIQSEAPVMVDLIGQLEKQNPKSKYLDAAYRYYLPALVKTGASAKIPEIAEKAVANFPENPSLLFFLANHAASHGQTDREVTFATRVIALWNSHPKPPEGLTDADWEHERDASLGPCYYMAGMVNAARSRWVDADQQLRAALPFYKGNGATEANILFNLGLANYNLGRMTMNKAKLLEGAKYSEECAAIQSPVRDQAWRNAQAMKAEASHMR